MNVLDFDQQLPSLDCRRVLRAYAESLAALPPVKTERDGTEEQPPQASRWVARLREVDGVVAARLAPIHGRLIAMGLLQFQLLSRNEGVVYQLTPRGHQMLEAPEEEAVPLRPCG